MDSPRKNIAGLMSDRDTKTIVFSIADYPTPLTDHPSRFMRWMFPVRVFGASAEDLLLVCPNVVACSIVSKTCPESDDYARRFATHQWLITESHVAKEFVPLVFKNAVESQTKFRLTLTTKGRWPCYNVEVA